MKDGIVAKARNNTQVQIRVFPQKEHHNKPNTNCVGDRKSGFRE